MDDFFKPELPEDTIYHIGVSGGKDSTAVLLWMVHESGIPKHKLDVTFCDTDNEHQWTYDQIALLNERVHPIQTLLPDRGFFDLAMHKRRFPSTKARFCTQHLKIIPSQRHITGLLTACRKVVAVSGVRGDESTDRAKLEEWDYSSALLTLQWRPIIKWTIADVLAIHKKHGIPLNPLYSMGAQRVGCFPCIMSRKAEMRNITLNFPERITKIRDAENAFVTTYGRYSSFFARNTVPERFRTKSYTVNGEPFMEAIYENQGEDHEGNPIQVKVGERPMMVASIDDVSRWSLTGKRAKGSYKDDPPEPMSCMSGFCE